ncbi:MAG: flagellar export chaperone FliS [Legionella sp.]|nr:flagellar export chaperone FliS [Legionella sp.]
MYTNSRSAANVYARIGLETGATPVAMASVQEDLPLAQRQQIGPERSVYTIAGNLANDYARVGPEPELPSAAAAPIGGDLPPARARQVGKKAGLGANTGVGASAYANVGLETGVVAATPHQLITMLYEGAEIALRMAIKQMKEGDVAGKSASITKASTIILEGLRAALDPAQGGEIAQRLNALYEYMNERLMLAHIKNQTAPLEEVLGLLQELHGAWKQIDPAAE